MFQSQSRLSLRGIISVAGLMLICGGAALADDVTSANYVMPGCRSLLAENNDTISALVYWNDKTCLPRGEISRGQITRVVVQYIDSRPARMHEDFRELAVEAMRAAWPCQR